MDKHYEILLIEIYADIEAKVNFQQKKHYSIYAKIVEKFVSVLVTLNKELLFRMILK